MSINDFSITKATGRMYQGPGSTLPANNITTVRSDVLMRELPMVKPSRNMFEGRLKSLRLYTRICRLVPFIIRIYGYQKKVAPAAMKFNIANFFREKAHLRRPEDIDHAVDRGYVHLHEAEQHYSDTHMFDVIIQPYTQPDGRYGYSYLTEKQYGDRSTFLKDFYTGNRPDY